MPIDSRVSQVKIKSRNGFSSRIKDAKVYVTDRPYQEDLGEADGTLVWTVAWQEVSFDTPKEARYIIIKAKDNNCLHLAEVEVYGHVTQNPLVSTKVKYPQISTEIAQGTAVAQVEATDMQGDALTYRITNDVPFMIDADGTITVAGSLVSGETYTIEVAVDDGVHTTTTAIVVETTASDALAVALRDGEASGVSLDTLYRALDEEEDVDNLCLTRLYYLYPTGVTVNPYKNYADHFATTSYLNTPIFGGQENGANVYYGFIGEKRNGARYGMLGASLRSLENVVKDTVTHLFKWLTKKEHSSDIYSEPLTIVVNGKGAKSDLQDWLRNNAVTTSWTITEDTSRIGSGQFDLYIAKAETTQNYKKATYKGKAVLIYDRPTWEQRRFFDLKYTGWKDTRGIWSSIEGVCRAVTQQEREQRERVATLLQHLKAEDLDIVYTDLSNINRPKGHDRQTNASLDTLIFSPLQGLRERLEKLDDQNSDIFDTNRTSDRYMKLLLLIADKYRTGIHYPMDKERTAQTDFYRAYFADSVILYSRENNKKQSDLGNFSRSDFSHITPTSKQITLTSKSPFRATGIYVLPGEKVTVHRTDNSPAVTKVFVNSIRSASTHMYEKDGYKRPKYLHSNPIEVKAGHSITFTSPYGGPLQVAFTQNDLNVSFEVFHIGLHPFWSEFDSDPEKDTKFEEALDANAYDWAELVTSAFEVHSKRDKMIKSIQRFRWGSASALAEGTKIYASSYPMSLAGFKGPGIAEIADAIAFAQAHAIPIYDADFVKHMNADQATCGYGCSGNPYDAFWAFDPIGFGDIHEVGHSLERFYFMLKGWEGHSRTNMYEYYTLIKYNQYVEQNGLPDRYYVTDNHVPKRVFKAQYEALQQCVGESDRVSCMQGYWASSDFSGQSLFLIQAMMIAQKYAQNGYALSNGFHLLTRLHLLERYLMRDAQEDWENNRAKLGFDTYTKEEITNLDANDWMVVSLSWATGMDYRPFFDRYGQPYSAKASTQVESFGFSPVTAGYFVVEQDSGFILPASKDRAGAYLDKQEVPLDGTSTYPY